MSANLNYPVAIPPFSRRPVEMSPDESAKYFDWFRSVAEERILVLQEVVRGSAGFAGWAADRSRESLRPLGLWFSTQIEVRPKTAEEIVRSRGPRIPSTELTAKSFSIAFDVGLYVAEVMTSQKNALEWVIEDRRGSIDLGQPVLAGFGVAPFNPVRMMTTLAYGLAAKTKEPATLVHIYDTWMERVLG
jgi:hypothetical protein